MPTWSARRALELEPLAPQVPPSVVVVALARTRAVVAPVRARTQTAPTRPAASFVGVAR